MSSIKENDGFYQLAKKIENMEQNETINWIVSDNGFEISMGSTRVWLMDCDLLITAAYGGGFVSASALWLQDGDADINDIYEYFKENYKGLEFVRFQKDDN